MMHVMMFIANLSSKGGQSEDMNIISTSRHLSLEKFVGGYISSLKMYYTHLEGVKTKMTDITYIALSKNRYEMFVVCNLCVRRKV